MKHNLNVKPERFKQLAVRVFGVDPAGKSTEEAALEGIVQEFSVTDSMPNFGQVRQDTASIWA